ncbi:MAG: phycobiliprotein lyase [Cyanobacteria bacterium P01_F01_bin.53]
MEIVNFFEKLAGRWFSQRTTHALSTQQSKAGKSDLEVEFLAPEDAEIVQILKAHNTSMASAQGEATPLCGLRIKQSSTVDGDTKPTVATTMLVPLTPNNPTDGVYSGTMLRSGSQDKSTYTLEDEVLTITSDGKEARSEERMWFITENLRMRTGITELTNGLRVASFCSEIRLGVKPPKEN